MLCCIDLWYELLEPLTMLFESSYQLGKLLDDYKIGHVTAVYKKGNKSDPSNYKPISLTSVICNSGINRLSIIRNSIEKTDYRSWIDKVDDRKLP